MLLQASKAFQIFPGDHRHYGHVHQRVDGVGKRQWESGVKVNKAGRSAFVLNEAIALLSIAGLAILLRRPNRTQGRKKQPALKSLRYQMDKNVSFGAFQS